MAFITIDGILFMGRILFSFDNSGQAGNPEWQTSTDNVDRTSAIIKMLAAEFAQPQYASVVVAIGSLSLYTSIYGT
jgi:hypothetical protein